MSVLGNVLLSAYVFCLMCISIYCLAQFELLISYLIFHIRNRKLLVIPISIDHPDLPFVSIQLPIYNEEYVVERLLVAVTQFQYPKDRFEIQVLDDSTDHTLEISTRLVMEYEKQGFQISLIHRSDRNGYKSGALKNGLLYAEGEFIAVFDADFIPNPDFLLNSLSYFSDLEIGLVQSRWEHLNKDYNLITRLQAIQLNVHFTIEQTGRMFADYLLQFNGTAGIWRKEAINDAGGWHTDTLTEDLDLSYRAQLKGWKVLYIESLSSPAELPVEMNGLKSQQFRWMKGGAECARKLFSRIWHSDLRFNQKIHASLHLLNSSIFLLIFLAGLLSVPLVFFFNYEEQQSKWIGIFLSSWVSIFLVYIVANFNKRTNQGATIAQYLKFLIQFPLFLSLSMGLSYHNSIAVLEGFRRKTTAFIRTPKYNIIDKKATFQNQSNYSSQVSFSTKVELVMAAYYLIGIFLGLVMHNYTYIVFHLLLFVGFSLIGYFSLKDSSVK